MMNLEIKKEGDMELGIQTHNREIRKNPKKWVSTESMVKRIEKAIYDMHHDSSITCFEEVAEQIIEELEK